MPRNKKPLSDFHDSTNVKCRKCGGQKPAIKYCSSCPQIDRHFVSGEHIHIRCGVCAYEAEVMNTLENTNLILDMPHPPRLDLDKDGV